MLTVLTFRWGARYSEADVRRLKEGCEAHLGPHTFVCLDEPEEPFPCTYTHACLRKLRAFEPGRFSGRVLQLDLDLEVQGDLRPWLEPDHAFIAPAARSPFLSYYSWAMAYYPALFPEVWTNLTPEALAAAPLFSDDGWISYKLGPGWPTWDLPVQHAYRTFSTLSEAQVLAGMRDFAPKQ
jgi:hypothetical protein